MQYPSEKSAELRTEQCQTTKQVLISHNGEGALISMTEIIYPKVPQSRESEKLQCSNCHKSTNTKVSYVLGNGAYCLIFLFVAFIITIPLALIVYILKRFRDAQHHCGECDQLIGTKRFLFG